MTESDHVERSWARAGVLFACAPAARTPDLERLLLATPHACRGNPRLLQLSVTWLAECSNFVARHRLKRLVQEILERSDQPALGLILEAAVAHGASRDLLIAAASCRPAPAPGPLFDIQSSPPLRELAERHASALSRKWGVWAPEVELKPTAIRPVSWILEHNPSYRDRIIRKGDLRVSILETLRHDVPGRVARSESEIARLAGANRSAVRKALAALEQEGAIAVDDTAGRDHPVRLLAA